MREQYGYLGLELAGAKNEKTALAALQYFPREKKIFLLDVFDRISAHDDQTSDEALVEAIEELKAPHFKMGVNVPLTLPPCIGCTRNTCPLPEKCSVPSVKWMRMTAKKAQKILGKSNKIKSITPYTQRPIEIWLRHFVLPHLPPGAVAEVDEALGGTKAPLTARMNFLLRHLGEIEIVEAVPRLTIALIAKSLGISRRTLQSYRHLEMGIHAREEILDKLISECGVFIYARDQKKLSENLACFDALICAYTALLADQNMTHAPISGFPIASGWVHYPAMEE